MFRFCVVTDRKLLKDINIQDIIKDAIAGGVDTVQIREKDLSSKDLLDLSKKLRIITKNKATLIINDRIDIALFSGADGVHLGSNSIPLSEAKKVIGTPPEFLFGVSCHSITDVLSAEKNKADYVFLGPIFYTSSKAKYGKPLGIDTLEEVRKKTKIKIIAIGGINENNVKECIDSGADGIAVISSIFKSDNPMIAAKRIFNKISGLTG